MISPASRSFFRAFGAVFDDLRMREGRSEPLHHVGLLIPLRPHTREFKQVPISVHRRSMAHTIEVSCAMLPRVTTQFHVPIFRAILDEHINVGKFRLHRYNCIHLALSIVLISRKREFNFLRHSRELRRSLTEALYIISLHF